MDDDELLRYSRQIMLPDLDVAGQERLLAARVLVIGVGGLGSPVALYLAAAGIGKLTLVDDDVVDLSNLQRQIAHTTSSIGTNKAASAARQIAAINPGTAVEAVETRADRTGLATLVAAADIVVDATDNFGTRFVLNEICWSTGTPLVSGAAIRWEGQVAVFDPRDPASPCYRCLYAEGDDQALNCSENGVVAPLVGVIGTVQALETIKLLTGVGTSLAGWVLYYDGKYAEWRKLKLSRAADCPVCGA